MRTLRNSGPIARSSLGIVLAAVAAAGLSACSAGGASPSAVSTKQHLREQNRESAVKPSVAATNQMSNGFAVTVARATYPKNSVGDTSADKGVVTIAPLVNGKPGDIAGFAVVRHGTSTNVTVPVQVQLRSGTYRVALYPRGKSPSDTQRPLSGTDVTVTVLSS